MQYFIIKTCHSILYEALSSVVCHLICCRPLSTFSDGFSEASGLVLSIFHIQPYGVGGTKVGSNGSPLLAKMDSMPIQLQGKKTENLLPQSQAMRVLENIDLPVHGKSVSKYFDGRSLQIVTKSTKAFCQNQNLYPGVIFPWTGIVYIYKNH